MSDQIHEQQNELATLIDRFSDKDGVHPTVIPSLFLIRESVVTEPIFRVNEPSFALSFRVRKRSRWDRIVSGMVQEVISWQPLTCRLVDK